MFSFFILFLIITLIIAGIYFYNFIKIQYLNSNIKNNTAILNNYKNQNIEKELQELKQNINLSGRKNNKLLKTGPMFELGYIVPEEININNFVLENNKVKMTGESSSSDIIFIMYERFQKSTYYENAELINIKKPKEDNSSFYNFQIEVFLKQKQKGQILYEFFL